MIPASGSRTTDGTLLTLAPGEYFEGHLFLQAGATSGTAILSFEGGGAEGTGTSGTALLAAGPNSQIALSRVVIYAGDAEATIDFSLGGISSGTAGAVGFIDNF